MSSRSSGSTSSMRMSWSGSQAPAAAAPVQGRGADAAWASEAPRGVDGASSAAAAAAAAWAVLLPVALLPDLEPPDFFLDLGLTQDAARLGVAAGAGAAAGAGVGAGRGALLTICCAKGMQSAAHLVRGLEQGRQLRQLLLQHLCHADHADTALLEGA